MYLYFNLIVIHFNFTLNSFQLIEKVKLKMYTGRCVEIDQQDFKTVLEMISNNFAKISFFNFVNEFLTKKKPITKCVNSCRTVWQ